MYPPYETGVNSWAVMKNRCRGILSGMPQENRNPGSAAERIWQLLLSVSPRGWRRQEFSGFPLNSVFLGIFGELTAEGVGEVVIHFVGFERHIGHIFPDLFGKFGKDIRDMDAVGEVDLVAVKP